MRFTAIFIFFLAIQFMPLNPMKAQQTAQDSTGLPGDNFSLQGALEMMKTSSSPEEFEKAINTESNHVNNLDLNGDGDIDYVRVIDKMEDKVHVFILQVPVSESENQDIAVIEIEKTGDTTAMLQIIGDEDIYGEEVIIEPNGGEEVKDAKKGKGPYASEDPANALIVVNVWYWPCVHYVYTPTYRPWVSPWRWHYYPVWWRPWRPFTWHVWHPFHHHYHRSYAVVHTHRVAYGPRIYRPVRTTSVTVHRRHAATVDHYRVNRTKTTVTGPRGRSATVKQTTVKGPRGNTTSVKRTTVRGSQGNVRGTKTTVTRRRH